MTNRSHVASAALIVLMGGLLCLTGCPQPQQGGDETSAGSAEEPQPAATDTSEAKPSAPAAPEPPAPTAEDTPKATASAEDVEAAKKLLDDIADATYKVEPGGRMTEIVIPDGSTLQEEDITLFGKLTDLESLQIRNFRDLNDEMVEQLTGLKNLTTLAITNSTIGNAGVETIVEAFPKLTNLDLSSNTKMENSALKTICQLTGLERLTLIQNKFNDLGTFHLEKLKGLRLLDLRGNMEAGDMTMEVVGALPSLVAFKHRSTTVTDYGMECLAECKTLRALLMQDFNVTGQSGQHLANLENLSELEILRCQGFTSDGVLPLKGKKLTRLTLRDLPAVDDRAMEVFTDLPELRRLYLHEIESISDEGLKNLENLKSLELLDIWAVPQMTDAALDVIAKLPNLKTLSIRTTGVTDAAVDKLLAMPNLESLTFKDNGSVSDEALKKLASKKWAKLDTGQ